MTPGTLHGLNSPLHPVPDSLEAALRAVPLVECVCFPEVVVCRTEHPPRPNYPALAAAAREWIRREIVGPDELAMAMCVGDPDFCLAGIQQPAPCRAHRNAASVAVADLARRLGLSQ